MSTALIVFKKELIETLRDRRTLVTMVAIPLLVFPLLVGGMARFTVTRIRTAQERTLRVAVMPQGGADDFAKWLAQRADVTPCAVGDFDDGMQRIERGELDALVVIANDFEERIRTLSAGQVDLYYRATERRAAEVTRMLAILDEYGDTLGAARFARLGLGPTVHQTIVVQEHNIATPRAKIAETIGGFLPYLFIIFCFTGCMYPAIDLAAGEKERGTLETLLTTPAGRFEILLGKFLVVVMVGLVAAGLSMVGLYIGLQQFRGLPPEFMRALLVIVEPHAILIVLSLLVPLAVFFAGLLLSVSIVARSYKEAQSYVSPLLMVVFLPGIIGTLPVLQLNLVTAMIPVLNVTLATKAVLAGRASPVLLTTVYAVMAAIAMGSLWLCAKIFGKESSIFQRA